MESRKTKAHTAVAEDPVCGMEVQITPTAIKTAYEKKTYYFCAEHCRTTFNRDPAHFAAM